MRKPQKYLACAIMALCGSHVFAANWGYSGQETHYPPEKWGYLKNASLCNKGFQQSPINIPTSEVAASGVLLRKEYGGNYIEINSSGHTITAKAGRYISIERPSPDNAAISSHRYELLQFHFHTLSEHTVSLSPLDTPKHYDMEMHLMHADKQGNLAIIALFIEEGEHNKTLADLFDNMPFAASHGKTPNSSDNKQSSIKIDTVKLVADYEQLLPSEGDLFFYSGSLTTPPCSEGVQWIVFVEPIQMSRQQIKDYRAMFREKGNPYQTNRPIQQRHGRTIHFGSSQ